MRVKDIHTQTDTHDNYRMPPGLRSPRHKKLSSIPQQYLCGEYTRKTGLTDAHNFKKLAAKI